MEDSLFRALTHTTYSKPFVVGGCEGGVEDETSDHLLAMSLQRQDDEAGHRDQEWQQFKQQNLGPDGNQLSE